jgi:hypothetical protein
MDSKTLMYYLRLISKQSRIVRVYVIAADEFDIINLAKLTAIIAIHSGERKYVYGHWLGLYIYKQEGVMVAEYFDSLGNSLKKYNIKLPIRPIAVNKSPIQCDESLVCGYHVIWYLYNRLRNKSSREIVNSYSQQCSVNDMFVTKFFKNLCVSCSHV